MTYINEVNDFIREFSFFEFSFFEFSNNNLVIVGSDDLIYYHLIEIKFENVYSIISNSNFRVDTTINSFSILNGEEAKKLNVQYRVERGNIIYKFLTEDGDEFYIIAESCSYDKNVVKYKA